MPEVDAALEELAHGDDGHAGDFLLFGSGHADVPEPNFQFVAAGGCPLP
jgi:hypothetical protein